MIIDYRKLNEIDDRADLLDELEYVIILQF